MKVWTAYRALLLAAYAGLVLMRMPAVLGGRFWAEEGNVFLPEAWRLAWLPALFHSYGGYLNLAANFGGLLAWHVVNLRYAPYATTALAFCIQLLPPVLLLGARSAWLQRPGLMAAALGCLLFAVSADEIWLSSIGSQVHLTLCTALILAFAPSSRRMAGFRLGVLPFAALSGPGSWLVLPLFVLKAAWVRSRRTVAEALALGAGVLVQLLFFYHPFAGRNLGLQPLAVLDFAYEKLVALPLLGFVGLEPLSRLLLARFAANMLPVWPALAVLAIAAAWIAALWRAPPPVRWMAAAFLLILGGTVFGALRPFTDMFITTTAGRYEYVPQVLIDLTLLGIAANSRTLLQPLAASLLSAMLVVGLFAYLNPQSAMATGPDYATELARHRQNPAHPLAGWPAGWTVRLPDDVPLMLPHP